MSDKPEGAVGPENLVPAEPDPEDVADGSDEEGTSDEEETTEES